MSDKGFSMNVDPQEFSFNVSFDTSVNFDELVNPKSDLYIKVPLTGRRLKRKLRQIRRNKKRPGGARRSKRLRRIPVKLKETTKYEGCYVSDVQGDSVTFNLGSEGMML